MKNILFIDDEINRMDAHILALEMAGMNVTCVNTMDSAIEMIKQITNYDLIIVDCMLTRSDKEYEDNIYGVAGGQWIIKKIRSLRKDVPIVILTVFAPSEILQNILEKDADAFLAKPILPSELIDKVKQLLYRKQD